MTRILSSVVILLSVIYLSAQSKTLEWFYKIGGTQTDYGVAVALDSEENVYDVAVFNGTASISFQTTYTSKGADDILIRKSTSLGIREWVKQLGSTGSDIATSIAVDLDDNIYVVGTYTDSLFLDNQFLIEGLDGKTSAFMLKLSGAGTMLWIKRIVSTSMAEIKHVTVGASEELVVSGNFEGTATFNDSLSIQSAGGRDIFLLKLNGLSGDILFHQHIGSPDHEFIYQHSRDNQNNIYLTGDFRSLIDLNPGNGVFLANPNGLTDVFLIKLNTFGEFLWARTFGGIGVDYGHSVTTDADRNVLITGRFSEIISFGSFNHVLQSSGGTDVFLAKINENGVTQWARKVGSSQNDQGSIVRVGPKNIIYLGGIFRHTVDFNPSLQFSNNSTSQGGADAFVALFNFDGTYNEHYTLGGLANENIADFAVRHNGEVISVGSFGAIVDFDPSSNVVNIFSNGGLDGFMWNVFVCVNPYLKSLRVEKDRLCFGERVMIEITEGYLNDATQWSWQRDSCDNITFASGDFLNAPVPRNTTFFVKGFGGCVSNDSCASIPISVFRDTLNYQNIPICEGDSVVIGTSVYKTAGVFIDSLVSVAGCDSVVVLEISVRPSYFSSGTTSICSGDTLRVGSSVYTLPGTYVNRFMTTEGCDSTIVTTLTVLPSIIENVEARVCKGDSLEIGNQFYSESGTYIQTSTNQFGCTDQLIVTIEQIETEFEQFVFLCAGDSLQVGNSVYKTAGAYQDKLISTLGCDSIISSFLSVANPSFYTQDVHLCFGDSLIVGQVVYKRTGNFLDTLVNAVGCDSIIESNVRAFNPEPITVFNLQICEGDSVAVGPNYYKETGDYVDTLINRNGCDSIIETQLNVIPGVIEISASICEDDFFELDTFKFTESGRYSLVYLNSLGCDSTLILDLTVLSKSSSSQSRFICRGDTLDLGYRLITEPGVYEDTLTNALGCDSLVTTTVEWNNKRQDLFFTICEGSFVEVNGKIYNTRGIYSDTLTLDNNCDSLLTINIDVWPSVAIDTFFTICRGEQLTVGNNIYRNPGQYTEFLQTSNGCDSIIRFELEVISFLPTFTHNSDTLMTALVEGARYQWYRCFDSQIVPLLGATNTIFIVPVSGVYTLAVTYRGCTFFADCVPIIKSTLSDERLNNLRIYPNPTSQTLHVEGMDEVSHMTIFRPDGLKVWHLDHPGSSQIISVNELSNGVYFIRLCTDTGQCRTLRFAKVE